MAWQKAFAKKQVSAGEVLAALATTAGQGVRELLTAEFEGFPSPRKLSAYLGRHEGRIVVGTSEEHGKLIPVDRSLRSKVDDHRKLKLYWVEMVARP